MNGISISIIVRIIVIIVVLLKIIMRIRLTWAYSWPCPPANLPWVRTAEIIRTAVKFTW